MERKIAEVVVSLFNNPVPLFDSDHAAEARALAAQQQSLYELLAKIAGNISWRIGNVSGSVSSNIVNDVFEWVENSFRNEKPRVDTNADGKYMIISPVPVIKDGLVQSLSEAVTIKGGSDRSKSQAADVSLIVCGGIIVESASFSNERPAFGGDPSKIGYAASIYSTEKAYFRLLLLVDNKVDRFIRQKENELNRIGERINEFGPRVDRAIERVEEMEFSFSHAKNRVENFEKTIVEELKLDRARITWQSRHSEAAKSFFICCVVIFLFFVSALFFSINYGLIVIKAILSVEFSSNVGAPSGAIIFSHQLSRILVFSVPVVVYFMMLRAVMRFLMRSMLLMDDARQRQTMLDTYFLLSEKGRADERDRPLILWALFRQTPGHGPDGIEPPDFTEVIKAGLDRAKQPS